ncbi:MAG TPA: hypothetical protein VN381_06880 [Anaerovoracaceae bacterium]|nr:hypothetical protein [Anaerovoracaceae bacterium]
MSYENTSLYNDLPEVLQGMEKNIKPNLYDTTLRDGEQTAGVSFSKEEKIEIALMLDELGVKRIEAGLPVISKGDRDAVEAIASKGLKAEIWGFSRCVLNDIDVNAEVGVSSIICEIATSEAKMKAYNYTEESVYEKAMSSLLHAKEKKLKTAFFAVDATKTRPGFLKKMYQDAVKLGGAQEVVLPDTMGGASPEAIYYLVRQLKQWVDVPVHIHCHNDLALATACNLAGIRAGADWLHVALNGLGERSGNSDLAEIAVAAKMLYDVDFGIDLTKLTEVADQVEQICGIKLSVMKPVTGRNIFTRDSGLVVTQLKRYPPSVELYPPEMVGQGRAVLINKKSGTHSIEYVMEELGCKITPETAVRMAEMVKKKAESRRGNISNAELLEMYNECKK